MPITPGTPFNAFPIPSADGLTNADYILDVLGAAKQSYNINGYPLSGNITISASDVGAVPVARTVNGQPLSSDVTITLASLGGAAISHTHGSITSDGKIGATPGLPLITTTAGAITVGSFGSTAGTFCQGNDSRLSDARTPTTHTHVVNDIANATTLGKNLMLFSNPSAVTFIRVNADNSITARSAVNFRSDIGLGNVENTAISTWSGSTNITTVGNITSGTWSGTAISVAKGGTGLTSLGAALQQIRVNAGGTALEYFTPSGGTGANLSFTLSATTVTVASDTGTDAVIPSATSTDAGVMSAADKNDLINAGSTPTAARLARFDNGYVKSFQMIGYSSTELYEYMPFYVNGWPAYYNQDSDFIVRRVNTSTDRYELYDILGTSQLLLGADNTDDLSSAFGSDVSDFVWYPEMGGIIYPQSDPYRFYATSQRDDGKPDCITAIFTYSSNSDIALNEGNCNVGAGGSVVKYTNAGDNDLILSSDLPEGISWTVHVEGIGDLTVTGSGCTFHFGPGEGLKTAGQYSTMYILSKGSGVFLVIAGIPV